MPFAAARAIKKDLQPKVSVDTVKVITKIHELLPKYVETDVMLVEQLNGLEIEVKDEISGKAGKVKINIKSEKNYNPEVSQVLVYELQDLPHLAAVAERLELDRCPAAPSTSPTPTP